VFNLAEWLRTTMDFASLLPKLLFKLLKAARKGNRNFEVERKYSITAKEHADLPGKLRSLGFRHANDVHMTDTFIPTVVDGDMCRIREEREDSRSSYVLTRKTWVHIDGQKEREEHEEKLTDLTRKTLLELGERLSNRPLLSFSKERTHYIRKEPDGQIIVALDLVEGLGEYSGDYMEVEILVKKEADVATAREAIREVALDLLGEEREPVQMSYQEMLKRTASPR
jgi:predicted adenylyl cyclase CyaB